MVNTLATPAAHRVFNVATPDAAKVEATLAPMAEVWEALGRVPDPEIPAISIVELGIVRKVVRDGPRIEVHVTPTYSGCPATDVIAQDIVAALQALGIADVSVITTLSPPWSTDWMAPEAKIKLAAYGIAPPACTTRRIDVAGISPLRRLPPVPCPRCGSHETSLLAQFGSTACKALYRCTACREPFDYFKPF